MPPIILNSVDDLPDELIVARNQGSLVLITGAGISVESNVPGYGKLIEEIQMVFSERLGIQIPPVGDGESYDKYLGKLEKVHKLPIRSYVQKRLVENIDFETKKWTPYTPNGLHIEILKLFKAPREVRIITLNYDPLQSDAVASVWAEDSCLEWYYSTKLPSDSSFNYISGIIYLHGSAKYSMMNDLVLTDGDYSYAYMGDGLQGRARRIMKDCLTDQRMTKLFIGATYSDPLIGYFFNLTDAPPRTFAFVSDKPPAPGQPSEIERWLERGVTPLVYRYDSTKKNPHEALLNILIQWNEKNLTEEPFCD